MTFSASETTTCLHKLIEKRTRLIEGRIKARQDQEAALEATK